MLSLSSASSTETEAAEFADYPDGLIGQLEKSGLLANSFLPRPFGWPGYALCKLEIHVLNLSLTRIVSPGVLSFI